ncbi:Methyl-CpG-binding domain protein 4 [Hordeum vulgare]|nr:Methyl-CpG-binding domain protein 4 [Hordeum vulgare]
MQLCGVDKYAADAYAIFCAGRAREMVPDDHNTWNPASIAVPLNGLVQFQYMISEVQGEADVGDAMQS